MTRSLPVSLARAIESVRQRVTAPGLEQFVASYNNDARWRRSRNRKPRTDVMVGGAHIEGLEGEGLVRTACKLSVDDVDAIPGSTFDFPLERYVDLGVRLNAVRWWEGRCGWLMVAEVENEQKELHGTLRDLVNIQARAKWAIFYSPISEKDATAALIDVLRLARADGQIENADTRYEVAVLPDRIHRLEDITEKAECFVSTTVREALGD